MIEIRAIWEVYAKRFNYDLEAICRDLKEQEKGSERKVVSFSSGRKGQRKKAKP